jgi:hypothetical protein
MLWAFFFAVCLGLGYPTLNRYDPAIQNPDASAYAKMVRGEEGVATHFRHRVLIPYLARPIFRAATGRVGSWNPAYFALLLVNSCFVSGTAFLLFMVASRNTGSQNIALLSDILAEFCRPESPARGPCGLRRSILLDVAGMGIVRRTILPPPCCSRIGFARQRNIPSLFVGIRCDVDGDEPATETAREADVVALRNRIGRHSRVNRRVDGHERTSALPLDLRRHAAIEPRQPHHCSGRSERPHLLVCLCLAATSRAVALETSASRMGRGIVHDSASGIGLYRISQRPSKRRTRRRKTDLQYSRATPESLRRRAARPSSRWLECAAQ